MANVYTVDANGNLLDIYNSEDEHLIPDGATVVRKDWNGLFQPRFDFDQDCWVETKTQTEIDNVKNKPRAPSGEDRLKSMEDAILSMLMGS